MNRIARILSVVLVLALAAPLFAVGYAEAPAATAAPEDKILYLGTQNDYPPFAFLDENNALTGFDIEFVKALDERLDGYTIEIQPLGWDSSFVAVDAGRIQMIVDQVAVNAEREEKYLFSAPYFTAQSVIFVKKGRTDIQSLDDLRGKKVRATTGDSYTMLLEAYNAKQAADQQIELVYGQISNSAEPFLDVANGRVDAYVNDPIMGAATIKELRLDIQITGQSLLTDPIAILLPKNDTGEALKKLFDPIIQGMIDDGTLAKLSEKWTQGDYIPQK